MKKRASSTVEVILLKYSNFEAGFRKTCCCCDAANSGSLDMILAHPVGAKEKLVTKRTYHDGSLLIIRAFGHYHVHTLDVLVAGCPVVKERLKLTSALLLRFNDDITLSSQLLK
jgi:hypothetical protein